MSDKNSDNDNFAGRGRGGSPDRDPSLRRVGTMGAIRWIILVVISLFAIVMVMSYFKLTPWESVSDKKEVYHCPMHPTYVSDRPGECPICGMTLTLVTDSTMANPIESRTDSTRESVLSASKDSVAQETYTCPMHPEVIASSPGKCPKCGMDLVKAKSTTKQNQTIRYTCPMHPEVISDTAGVCPKCGMALEPQSSASMQSSPQSPEATSDHVVPGHAAVMIAPSRLQMIGVRYAPVEWKTLTTELEVGGYVAFDESKIVNVTSRVSGWARNIHVQQTGEIVAESTPLVTIYSPEMEQAQRDYITALESERQSHNDSALNEIRRLVVASGRDRLSNLGMSATDIAHLESSGATAAEFVLRSATHGVILSKEISAGQSVNIGQTLFTIGNASNTWVMAEISESEISSIHLGQTATVIDGEAQSQPLTGRVEALYPTISDATRRVTARIGLFEPAKLRPGALVTVGFKGEASAGLSVAREAVMDDGGLKYVFVATGAGKFEPRQISIGRSGRDWVEALSGVKAGDSVVTSANFLIDSESRLRAALEDFGSADASDHSAGAHQK